MLFKFLQRQCYTYTLSPHCCFAGRVSVAGAGRPGCAPASGHAGMRVRGQARARASACAGKRVRRHARVHAHCAGAGISMAVGLG